MLKVLRVMGNGNANRAIRPGRAALLAAGRVGQFGILLVDDLSRLARDNYRMLSVLAELHFAGVRVVSVADGLDSNDEESTLGIQIRGIFNELLLRDLKKKTLRGQIGQKQRGFSVGERTLGYRSFPSGPTRMDKKGRPRPEGYKIEIEPREAALVLRIFQAFVDGLSLTRIVRMLNEEGVPGRFRSSKGWSPANITRLLGNSKYIGHWVWNKTESRRDPRTGRRRRFLKPESEWVARNGWPVRMNHFASYHKHCGTKYSPGDRRSASAGQAVAETAGFRPTNAAAKSVSQHTCYPE